MSPTVICRAFFPPNPWKSKKNIIVCILRKDYVALCHTQTLMKNSNLNVRLHYQNYIRWTFFRFFPGESRKVPDFAYSYLRDKAEAKMY